MISHVATREEVSTLAHCYDHHGWPYRPHCTVLSSFRSHHQLGNRNQLSSCDDKLLSTAQIWDSWDREDQIWIPKIEYYQRVSSHAQIWLLLQMLAGALQELVNIHLIKSLLDWTGLGTGVDRFYYSSLVYCWQWLAGSGWQCHECAGSVETEQIYSNQVQERLNWNYFLISPDDVGHIVL